MFRSHHFTNGQDEDYDVNLRKQTLIMYNESTINIPIRIRVNFGCTLLTFWIKFLLLIFVFLN